MGDERPRLDYEQRKTVRKDWGKAGWTAVAVLFCLMCLAFASCNLRLF